MKSPKLVIFQNGIIVDEVFLGIVAQGESSEIIVDLRNVGDFDVYDLVVSSNHLDVLVKCDGRELKKGASVPLILFYSPKVQLDEGVNSKIVIDAKYVV